MSINKGRNRKGISNDLDNNDPDFDLDSYINEQSNIGENETNSGAYYQIKKKNTRKRDAIVIAVFAAFVFLWFANPFSSVNENAGSNEQIAVFESQESGAFATPSSFTEYLSAVLAIDFKERPSTSQIQALYNNGVPMDYMRKLEELNYLGEINYSGIIGLWANGVSEDYLQTLHDLDLLDDTNYSGIIGLYANGVSIEYLQKLEELDYLDEVNYSGIIGLYANGVTIEYLETLNRVDYLDQVNYSGIIGMYANGVPISLIEALAKEDLLDDLSYSDIIRIHLND